MHGAFNAEPWIESTNAILARWKENPDLPNALREGSAGVHICVAKPQDVSPEFLTGLGALPAIAASRTDACIEMRRRLGDTPPSTPFRAMVRDDRLCAAGLWGERYQISASGLINPDLTAMFLIGLAMSRGEVLPRDALMIGALGQKKNKYLMTIVKFG